jgi:hypothetical protein
VHTLVQALRLCTGPTAHRRIRGIALPFHDHGTRRGWGISVSPGRYLPAGKTRYPLYRRLGGLQGRSGQVRKISPPPGFDPRTVRPVASRYTDYATQPTHFIWYIYIIQIYKNINSYICKIRACCYFISYFFLRKLLFALLFVYLSKRSALWSRLSNAAHKNQKIADPWYR